MGVNVFIFLIVVWRGIVYIVLNCLWCFVGMLLLRFFVDIVSEFEIFFGIKIKGGDIGLNGYGMLVIFLYCYSEEVLLVGEWNRNNV